LRLLKKEVARISGVPQEQAKWAVHKLSYELAAVACMSFTATLKAFSQPLLIGRTDEEAVILSAISSLNDITNAIGIAITCGILQQGQEPPQSECEHCSTLSSAGRSLHPALQDDPLWSDKVEELAGRGVRLGDLLDFTQDLLATDLMPHFDPDRSTTNDVVRHAIVPLSRRGDGLGGVALATVWNEGRPAFAQRMVTHHWGNKFMHLIGAIVADALQACTYEAIVASLVEPGGIDRMRGVLHSCGRLDTLYWVCAFSINQHASICRGYGPPPCSVYQQQQRSDWEAKRLDTVTRTELPLCTCEEPKFFNDTPMLSELNKFDDVMAFLFNRVDGFSQVVAVDATFSIFSRAWCVAELVEAEMQQMPQRVVLHSEASLNRHYESLSLLDVGKCRASSPGDVELILTKIGDVAAFNARLQRVIFGTEGLFANWASTLGSCAIVGRLALRASLAQAAPSEDSPV